MPTELADALTAYRAALRPAGPTGRRGNRRAMAGTALLLAVLAGGAAATVLPGTPPTPGRAPQLVAGATPTPAPATSTPDAPSPHMATPLASVPPTTWRRWTSPALTTWVPAIPSAGPTDPDRLAGFTRTPEGALSAAASLHPAIYYARDEATWTQLADTRVAWADGQREQLAEALTEEWNANGTPTTTAAPVGYRLISYSPDRAEFRLWWRWQLPGDATPILGALVIVLWDGTDWRLWFDEPAMDMRELETRDSYLPWGPA